MGKKTAVAKKAPAKATPKASAKARVTHWTKEISETWQCAVESIIATGEQLIEAKEDLKGYKGEWAKLCDQLPFSDRTAQMLMKIANTPRLTDPKHVSVLPPSWGTLYELTKLDDKTFKQAMAKGTINPEMERKDAEALLGKSKPKIDRDAEDAQTIDNEPEGDEEDEGEENNEGEVGEEEEDEGDEPAPKTKDRPTSTGPVEPKLSKHDKKVVYVADTLEVLATRLGEFEEMLDSSDEVRKNMSSRVSRDMLKRAQEISLTIERMVKKYLKS